MSNKLCTSVGSALAVAESENNPLDEEEVVRPEEQKQEQAKQDEHVQPQPTSTYRITEPVTEDGHLTEGPMDNEAGADGPWTDKSDRCRRALLGIVSNPIGRIGILGVAMAGAYIVLQDNSDKPMKAEATGWQTDTRMDRFPEIEFRRAERGSITRTLTETMEEFRQQVRQGGRSDTPSEPQEEPHNDREQGRMYTQAEVETLLKAVQSRVEAAATLAEKGSSIPKKPAPMRSHRSKGPRRAVKAEPSDKPTLPAYLYGDATYLGNSDGQRAEKEERLLDISTRIPAVLDVGISSARHGVVVAKTREAIRDNRGTIIPKGAILIGRSSSGANRIYIEFQQIETKGKKFSIKGVALEGNEAGLLAQRIESSAGERVNARLSQGALGALKGVASLAGPVGQIVSGATDGAVGEAQREYEVDRSVVLQLPAGTQLSVVITG